MNRLLMGRVALRLILLLCLLVLVRDAGTWTRVAVAGVAFAVLLDLVRLVRQGEGAQGNLAAAKYVEPGDHRVVLQVPGANPVLVMREVRRTTGLQLIEVRKIVDDTPAIVAEGLSEASAQAVVERLQLAGARAIAAPMEAIQ